MEHLYTENGEYTILYAENGRLSESALAQFALAARDGYDFLYADHTVHFQNGTHKRVRKPGWSPDTLLSVNYIESPIAVRSTLLPQNRKLAFSTPEERYAAILYVTERVKAVHHISESLFDCGAFSPCESKGPIESALRRRRIAAEVERGTLLGSFAVRYPLPVRTRISCIVYGNLCEVHAFRQTLESIALSCCWPNRELFIVDGGAIDARKERYYATLLQMHAADVIRNPGCKSMPRLLEEAAYRSKAELLLFLPAGTELRAFDLVERMAELAIQPHAGAVGGVDAADAKAAGIIHNTRMVGNVLMVRREVFYALGGFDDTFSQAGYLEAFSILLNERGYRNIMTPYARYKSPAAAECSLDETNKLRIQDLSSFLAESSCGSDKI